MRNLLDPVRPKGQQFWVGAQSSVPLETDVLALEYLASYDYDVEKALFNLYCEIGRGKGEIDRSSSSTGYHFPNHLSRIFIFSSISDAVFTQKAVAMTERTASNVIFSDCKDRLLRVPPHAMFGAYYAAFNHGRLPNADSNHHSASSAASAAAAAFGGAIAGLANILTGHSEPSHSSAGLGTPAHSAGARPSSSTTATTSSSAPQQLVIFSSIISHPMQQADCERLLSAAAKLTSSGDLIVDAKPKISITASRKSKSKSSHEDLTKDASADLITITTTTATTATTTVTATSAGAGSGGEEEEEVFVRASKPRGASSDKAELRKKWLYVAQKAASLLNQGQNQGYQSASNHTVNGRGTLVAAQALLEHACTLPPYSNMSFSGSAVVNSTSAANMSTAAVAAAQEEAGLLDNVGVLLGKLVKVSSDLFLFL